MNYPRLLFLSALAFLLSSCGGISWNFSNRVAELPDSCVGVDVSSPVVLYTFKEQVDARVPRSLVMQVPEVTYSPHTHIVASGDWATMERLVARDVKPTGRLLWVQKDIRNPRVKLLDGKPEGLVRCQDGDGLNLWSFSGANGINPRGIGHLSTTRSAWGPLATAASVPLFAVDCVLGVTTNAAGFVVGMAMIPVVIVSHGVQNQVADVGDDGEKVLLWSEVPKEVSTAGGAKGAEE